MCVCGWGRSATGLELWVLWTHNMQESATGESWHPGVSYWADWRDPHCRCGYVFPIKGLSFWSAREGNRMRLLVLFVPVWVLNVSSVLICVPSRVHAYCVYVCMCAYREHARFHYWLDMVTWSCGSLSSVSLLDSATPDAFVTDLTLFLYKHL